MSSQNERVKKENDYHHHVDVDRNPSLFHEPQQQQPQQEQEKQEKSSPLYLYQHQNQQLWQECAARSNHDNYDHRQQQQSQQQQQQPQRMYTSPPFGTAPPAAGDSTSFSSSRWTTSADANAGVGHVPVPVPVQRDAEKNSNKKGEDDAKNKNSNNSNTGTSTTGLGNDDVPFLTVLEQEQSNNCSAGCVPSASSTGTLSPTQIVDSFRQDVQHAGCTCKKTRCLKLYCQCFAMQLYCGINCRCMACFNVPSQEKARQEAIRAILTRNPHALDIKYQKKHNNNPNISNNMNTTTLNILMNSSGTCLVGDGSGTIRMDAMTTEDLQSKVAASAGGGGGSVFASPATIMTGSAAGEQPQHQQQLLLGVIAHKIGCKCRKSACMKKYCECFAGNVRCTSNCRCIGCKNMTPGQFSSAGPLATAGVVVVATPAPALGTRATTIPAQQQQQQQQQQQRHYPSHNQQQEEEEFNHSLAWQSMMTTMSPQQQQRHLQYPQPPSIPPPHVHPRQVMMMTTSTRMPRMQPPTTMSIARASCHPNKDSKSNNNLEAFVMKEFGQGSAPQLSRKKLAALATVKSASSAAAATGTLSS